MAIVSLERTTVSVPGGSAWAEVKYNNANNRVTTIDWSIPASGVSIRVRIWDGSNLVYNSTYGQGSGAETIPGSYRVVWVSDPDVTGGGYYALPSSLTWQYNIETIGQ